MIDERAENGHAVDLDFGGAALDPNAGWFPRAMPPGPDGRARELDAIARLDRDRVIRGDYDRAFAKYRYASAVPPDELAAAEREADQRAARRAADPSTSDYMRALDAKIAATAAAQSAPRRWRRCRELVDEILRRASEPWIALNLAGNELVSVRAGGIVLLTGGTGRGKTSLALAFGLEHARDSGVSIVMSLEIPADEATARAIGTRCDASWPGVLRGDVPRDRMVQVLPERLAIIARQDASIAALEAAIVDLRREYPGKPILVVVDYVQLVGADSDDDIRPRIGRVMRELDRVARDHRVVMIALSQGSRASSRALASGEKIGADTTDAGAESADLERWASVTLAIGTLGNEADDGTCAAELSIGKGRMTGGDRVVPARYNGRSGLWRIVGEARPAAEVKAERTAERDASKVVAAELAISKAASELTEPVTREELAAMAATKAAIARQAIANLLARGELVEVERRKPRSRAWKVWTRPLAEAAGIAIVADTEADR